MYNFKEKIVLIELHGSVFRLTNRNINEPDLTGFGGMRSDI